MMLQSMNFISFTQAYEQTGREHKQMMLQQLMNLVSFTQAYEQTDGSMSKSSDTGI